MLPRRRADLSSGQPGLQGTHTSGLFADGFSWFCYQPKEEQSVTNPVIQIPGNVGRHSGILSPAHVSKASTTARQCPLLMWSQDSVGQAVCGCLRSDGISSPPPASGASSQESLAEAVSPSVVSSHGRMGTTDFPGPVVCVSS